MKCSGYSKNGPCCGFWRDVDLWSFKDHRPMVSAISESFSSWSSCSAACQVKVYCSYSTCAEGNGVHKCAWDLLCRSLVPQREVIGIKHTLFVLRCQEISEEGQRMKRSHKGLHSSAWWRLWVMIRETMSGGTHWLESWSAGMNRLVLDRPVRVPRKVISTPLSEFLLI